MIIHLKPDTSLADGNKAVNPVSTQGLVQETPVHPI